MRGQIKNRFRSLQVKDYSGLCYKNITPTDLDGFFEIQNKVFVFIELKLENTPLPLGQILALERLTDNLNKPAILIITRHNCPPELDIDVANCIVERYRWRKIWYEENKRTVKKLIDSFLIKRKLGDYL